MRLLWEEKAWNEYCNWQTEDKKSLKKINAIIKDIQRSSYDGIGKPEPLKDNLSGWWSRKGHYSGYLVIYFRFESTF